MNPTVKSDQPLARLESSLAGHGQFQAGGAIHLARAPGRLDVMGGIADYTGSRVCQLPRAIAAGAAVQRRKDGLFFCQSMQVQRSLMLPVQQITGADARALRELIAGQDIWARYIAGCLWWLAKHQPALDIRGGVSVLVDSDVPLGGGVSSSAAIEVATMSAMASLLGVALTPMQLAAACQVVENQVVGAPCGVMDQVASCMGQADAMLEILCQPAADGSPAQLLGVVKVPPGCTFIGIHSGVRHEVTGDPYAETRVAAFMAHKIIFSHKGMDDPGHHLANLPLDEYEQLLRPLLPVELSGKAFLDRWTSSHDTVTTIDPARTYRVQAAADHHVREMHRVTRFVNLLRHQPTTEQDIRQAGLLMNESHHSYGDNARQGHELTDRLADMLAEAGPGQGIFGQRITGGGCGGTLAVLMRDEPACHERIAQIRQRYERETGRRTQLFTGSTAGAAAHGVIVRKGTCS